MAEYALDTHACIFALAAPKKLGGRARRTLQRADDRGETVWLPAAAATEVVLLKQMGRTDIGLPDLRQVFDETCWRFLPLDLDQIDEFSALAAIRDPFDRLVVAAARSAGAKLITRDAKLHELGLIEVIWS